MKKLILHLLVSVSTAFAGPDNGFTMKCQVAHSFLPGGTEMTVTIDRANGIYGYLDFYEAPWNKGVKRFYILKYEHNYLLAVAKNPRLSAIEITNLYGTKRAIKIGDLIEGDQFGKHEYGTISCD